MTPTLTTAKATPVERRRGNVISALHRAAFEWFFVTDLRTCEQMLLTFWVFIALAVSAISPRIISEPPPVLQPYALTLPAWMWTTLLITGALWQLWGRLRRRYDVRRNGALLLFFTALALCGPLYLRGPGLALAVSGAVLWQCVCAARLWRASVNARRHR